MYTFMQDLGQETGSKPTSRTECRTADCTQHAFIGTGPTSLITALSRTHRTCTSYYVQLNTIEGTKRLFLFLKRDVLEMCGVIVHPTLLFNCVEINKNTYSINSVSLLFLFLKHPINILHTNCLLTGTGSTLI